METMVVPKSNPHLLFLLPLSFSLSLSLSFSLPPYASSPSNSARQSSRATPSRSGLVTTTPRSNPLALRHDESLSLRLDLSPLHKDC
jgi:hypothetical protein